MTEVETKRIENPIDEITLPRLVVLKSNNNNKYLSCTKFSEEDGDQVPAGFLKFSGQEVGSHYAKFEVEMAKSSENQGLVHIRCCYNNKYWVRHHDHWIVAQAEEPEEDRSKNRCTLFEPIITVEEFSNQIINEEDDNDAISDGETSNDTEQRQDPEVIDTHHDSDVIEHLQDPDAIDDPQNIGDAQLNKGCQDQPQDRVESNVHEDHQSNELVNHDDDEEINSSSNNNNNENDNNNNLPDRPRRREMNGKRMLVRLRHVQLGHYVGLRRDNVNAQHLMGGLSTSPDNTTSNTADKNDNRADDQTNREGENSNSTNDQNNGNQTNFRNEEAPCDLFTVINWESLVIFPKHVAFRGDNGVFLSSDRHMRYDDNNCLMYEGEDIKNDTVAHEIFTNPDGSIRIKSDYLRKFWRRRPGDQNWIVPDSDEPTHNDTLFQPIKIHENEFAIRNMGNFHICKRYTYGIVGFTANITRIAIFAHLRIEEIVQSRIVYNVNYRLMHARIYDYQHEVEIAIGEAANLTQETTGLTCKLSYKRTKSMSWNDAKTMSMKSGGVRTTMQAGVPVIGDDGKLLIISNEFTCRSTIRWGEVEIWEPAVQSVCKVDVPAMTKVNVRLVATKASYEVPFNYSRRDTPFNGRICNDNNMDDGIYIGSNFFSFKYNIEQIKL